MRVKISALLCWQAYLIFSIICNLCVASLPGDVYTRLEIMGYIYVLELLVFCVMNTARHGRFWNFGNVFILVLFVFHFGQLVLYTFFREIYTHIRFLLLLEAEDAFSGFHQMHMAFSALCVGMLLVTVKTQKGLIKTKDININLRYDFESIAKRIILITFPVKLFIDIMCLFLCVTVDATEAREWVNTFPNVLLYYGKVALVGFALLLLIYRKDPPKQTKLFIFIMAYILVMMVSGIRSENVGYLCVFALLYFASKVQRVRILPMIGYTLAGFLILAFVIAAGAFRGVEDKSLQSFWEVFVNSLTEENPVFSLMDTCGDTGYTAQCVINKWLPQYGPTYGDSYYLGWIAIIPNIPKVLTFPGTITAASHFALRLQETGTLSNSYHNIGGSLIGEMFFNFGLYGAVIVAFALGVILGNVSYRSKVYIEEDNHYGMLWLVPTMFAVVYWVRDYFGGEIREIVWGPLIGLLVMRLFFRAKRRLNSEQSVLEKDS